MNQGDRSGLAVVAPTTVDSTTTDLIQFFNEICTAIIESVAGRRVDAGTSLEGKIPFFSPV